MRRLGILVYKVTVGGADQRAVCELRKRDVIGMSVGTIRAERDNNLWLNAPNVRDKLSNDLFRVRLIYIAIDVIKETHFLETELFRGAAQLRFTDTSHTFESWVGSLRIEPAAFSTRRADEIRPNAFGGITRQG